MQGHGLVGKSVCSNTSIVTYGETAARGRNDQNLCLIFILCHNSSVNRTLQLSAEDLIYSAYLASKLKEKNILTQMKALKYI